MGKKEKKPVRNKFKDTIWDYYTTNREISKEYAKAHEEEAKSRGGQKKKWSGTERMYLVVILAGLVLIAVKYLFF